MVGVLLDTCVISELYRANGDPRVRAFVDQFQAPDLHLSVITIGELIKGAGLLPPSRRRTELTAWTLSLETDYAERLLSVDIDVARIWGEFTALGQQQGIQIPLSDGLIAATGLRYGLRVVTRNTKHFAATGVALIDPWET